MLGERIGEGRTAEIYAWGEQVVKLFRSEFPASNLDYEYKIALAVQEAGVNAPLVGEIVEVDGRRGIVYQRVDGVSILRLIAAKPWQMMTLARQFAETHALMHERTSQVLPPVREKLRQEIQGAPLLDEIARTEILRRLEHLPYGDSVCHGDYHPNNVILSRRGPVVIDWTDARRGDRLADVARTSLLFSLSSAPPGVNPVARRVVQLVRNVFYSIYLNRYRQLLPFDYAALAAWMLSVAAARLNERIPGEETALLALIQASLQS